MEQYTIFIDINAKIKRSVEALRSFERKALQIH